MDLKFSEFVSVDEITSDAYRRANVVALDKGRISKALYGFLCRYKER